MRKIVPLLTVALICIVAISCTTPHPKATACQPIQVSVRAKVGTVFKVLLDGKVVGKGKGRPSATTSFSFSTTPGNHILKATAPGLTTWERSIQVVADATAPEYFYVLLEQ